MSDKPPVILVAEDDKSVRLVVQQALARQGYNVQSSGNAAGLWKLIESGRGDVLITDVAFPDGDVATGAGGLPASQYVPNPASPGPGSQNPTDMPAPPEGFGQTPNGDTYGSGTGALTRPADTSKTIARHTLGSYGLGTSEPTK